MIWNESRLFIFLRPFMNAKPSQSEQKEDERDLQSQWINHMIFLPIFN